MMGDSEIFVLQCGGSKINYRRPLFSANSKYLLCVSGNAIKVFSTVTEECIHILQNHSDLVTGIELNPNNPLQLYSCSLDGTVKLWDFTDGILIKTFLIGFKLFGLYTTLEQDTLFVITQSDTSSEMFQLMSVKLAKSMEQKCEARERTVLFEDVSQLPKSTAVGRNGEYVVTVKGLCLFVYHFKNKKRFRFPLRATSVKGANNIFTVVTCHPVEDCIATGHRDGKIRLWRNFNHKRDFTYSSLHWHHDSVADLAFSVQGTVLYSGGVESVLVQWSHSLEHKREFLPRLGAAIEHIATSPDGSLSTSHMDNKVTIIDANLKVTGIIQGLVKGNDMKTGLMLDPRTNALVLNGKPGHLQFYSLHDDKQLYNLDIVQQEFVHQAGLQHIDLVKAALNAKGNWLATVEELKRKGADHLEIQMKFWEYNEKLQSFVLNTTINMPHEHQITSLSFQCGCDSQTDTPTLVTTGNDGLFKVWVLENNSDTYWKSRGWSCDFIGNYHGFKATACSFSEDGSLLAVSFEDIVTIWESGSWDLKHTFCQPPGKIRSLCFGRLSSSKYLLASTNNGFINCWDLLTCNLKWRAHLDAIVLQPDSVSETIAAFSTVSGSSTLFIFSPADPVPLYIHMDVCLGSVQWAVFVPRDLPEVLPSKNQKWLIKSQLYFITEDQELMTFSTRSAEEMLEPLSKRLAPEGSSLPFTPFFTLLEKKRQQKLAESMTDLQLEKSASVGCKTQDSHAIKELLHTPAHVLPPAATLCSLFVDSLLISHQYKCAGQDAKDLDKKNDKAEEDSDEELTTESKESVVTQNSFTTCFKHLKCKEKELRRIRKRDFNWVTVV